MSSSFDRLKSQIDRTWARYNRDIEDVVDFDKTDYDYGWNAGAMWVFTEIFKAYDPES